MSFAVIAAHELRTPVALQRALVEVALADPRADASALREMGERVVASCVRQQRLIDALLGLAQDTCGMRREPVDVAAITAEAIREHEPGGLELVATLEPAWTTGDADLLGRLAANLVSNAIRHNVSGGRVEIGTRSDAGRAVLAVANTGRRIRACELPPLFQPFKRCGGDGAGLGLAVVQSIADAHDALISARPRPGGGLRIEVAF